MQIPVLKCHFDRVEYGHYTIGHTDHYTLFNEKLFSVLLVIHVPFVQGASAVMKQNLEKGRFREEKLMQTAEASGKCVCMY